MALVVEQLQLWVIGFKWAGLDPNRPWFRLPTSARDSFSTLLEEILNLHLDCLTLRPERYEGDDPEAAKFHIRYWLDDINAAIHGKYFNRKLLKWAVIDRGAFQDWCERRSIPLPEFWFPSGWTPYRWPEDDPPAQSSVAPPPDMPAGPTPSVPGEAPPDSQVALPTIETPPDASRPLISTSPEDDPALTWRVNQRNRAACQVIAEVLWKANPDMTIRAMSKQELIQIYGRGANYVGQDTVYDWIKVVAPPAVREKRGRPKKENPSEDE